VSKVSKKRIVITKAKKKTAIARARIKEAKSRGQYRINSQPVEVYGNELTNHVVLIPITIAKEVLGKTVDSLDIAVRVSGGGVMGQAEAVKVAVAKALIEWTGSEKLKKAFLEYDRNLLVDDVRKKEPKKYLRDGARAKPQKSYR